MTRKKIERARKKNNIGKFAAVTFSRFLLSSSDFLAAKLQWRNKIEIM